MRQLSLKQKEELLEQLLNSLTEHKASLFENNIPNRTKHLTVVLEDIFQSQNASAVLRSADCFGIQDVHIIEKRNEYILNPDVALGSSKWLNMYKYNALEQNNTLAAYKHLREQGYQIVATTPHKDEVMLDQLDISKKTAIVFGNERDGLSEDAINNADVHMKIPMYGFTESFNISVSAALCMFHLSEKMRASEIDWKLTKEEELDVMVNWAKSVVKSSEQIENRLFGILEE